MNLQHLLSDFPALSCEDPNPTYLDSAATSLTPNSVIRSMNDFHQSYCANIHRGAYRWSAHATELYEEARQKIARLLGADDSSCCIFTPGTTLALNMLAYSLEQSELFQKGDSICLSIAEHHANLIPWQQLSLRQESQLHWIELCDDGTLDMESYQKALKQKPKLVALSWVSNVFGTIHPVKKMIQMAHDVGALVILDAAQGVPHLACDVKDLDCDFLVFSGHKALGPTGIGVLWGKPELLRQLPPSIFGGQMIAQVKRDRARWADIPQRFEAGTPPIAEAIALGTAADYLMEVGLDSIRKHEQELLQYAFDTLGAMEGMKLYGPCDIDKQSGVVSFDYYGVHPHDIATILDRQNIFVRAGHHCCQPLMREMCVGGTTRASFYLYNQKEEIDLLAKALLEVKEIFASVITA